MKKKKKKKANKTMVSTRVVLSFSVSLLQTLFAGLLFANAAFASNIPGLQKDHLQQALSFALSMGFITVLPCGALFDWSGSPRLLSLLAVVFGVAGYVGESFYSNESWFITALLLGCGAFAMSFSYVTAMNSAVIVVPPSWRGVILGSLEAAFGLSSVFYTQLAHAIPDTGTFFRVSAGIIAGINLLAALFVNIDEAKDLHVDDSTTAAEHSDTVPLVHQTTKNKKTRFDWKEVARLMMTIDYWCMIVFFTTSGALFVVGVGSAAEFAESKEQLATIANVVTVLNAASRIVFGALSDVLKHKWHVPRSVFLVLVALLTMATGILMQLRVQPVLAYALLGTALGGSFVSPSITADLWGSNGFGSKWGMILALIAPVLLLASNLIKADIERLSICLMVVGSTSILLTMKLCCAEVFKMYESRSPERKQTVQTPL